MSLTTLQQMAVSALAYNNIPVLVDVDNGSVSVKYSNFVKVIADKSLKTRQILGE